jgi:YidC/Oxa1 family membrane protein insertase
MFGAISNFFYIILYQPLFNSLVILYNYIPGHDFGVTIIALTLVVRVVLFPISLKAVNSQRGLQKLQPKMQEAQKKHKDDKEKQAKAILELYKTEKINPFSGLLLVLIQLPILIALYSVFRGGFDPKQLTSLYGFVFNPGHINPLFLHIIDLSKPNLIFAVLAGLTQYFQTKMLLPKNDPKISGGSKQTDMAQVMQKQMTYFMPVFTIIILIGLPSALGLYWTISGLFSVIQQYLIFKKNPSIELVKTSK